MDHDLIVCGGGPAGLCTAIGAAEGGADVLLIERSKVFGEPVHDSGGSFSGILEEWDLPERIVARRILGTNLIPPSGEVITIDHTEPLGIILERRELNKELAKKASSLGVRIRIDERVVAPIIDGGSLTGVRSVTSEGVESETTGKVIVDATGVGAVLTRAMGMYPEPVKVQRVLGCQYEMADVDIENRDHIDLIFGNRVAPGAYGWIFPKSGNTAIVGLGIHENRIRDRPLGFFLKRFLETEYVAKAVKDAQPIEYHAGVFPVGPMFKSYVRGNFVSIGDSGCQGSPHLGEGIRFVMYNGRIAGQVIGEMVKEGRDEDDLMRIPKRIKKEVYPNYKLLFNIYKKAITLTDDHWNKVLPVIGRYAQSEKGRQRVYKFFYGSITLREMMGMSKEYAFAFRK